MADETYQIPSSFAWGINQASSALWQGNIPQLTTSPFTSQTNVSQPILPQKKTVVPTKPQKKELLTLDEKKRRVILLEQQWATQQEIQAYLDTLKESEQNTIEKKGYNPIETAKENLKWIKDFYAGVYGSVPKQLGNIVKFGTDVLWNVPWFQPIKEYGKKAQELWNLWQELVLLWSGAKDTLASKVWGFTGEVVWGIYGGWALTKWASLLPKAWVIAQKLPFLTKVAKWATEGLGFDIVSQWEAWAGTAIGGALPFVWATFNKAKELLTSKLPKSFIARWMATPSALKNASERLSRLADDGIIDINKAPEWMLKKWLQGSKSQIQKQLTTIIQDSGKKKAGLLASGNPLTNVKQVQDLQQGLWEVLSNFAKVTKKWEVIPTAWNKEIVGEIVAFINNMTPTPAEFERARSLLGNMGIFTKSGALADSAQKEGLQKIWIQASKYLDDTFPWFREINKDIEVANALGKAIWLKEAQDSVRNLLTLTNLWMGGIWASYWYAKEGNLQGALTYWLGALWARYILNNPAVLTRLAQWLSGKKLKTTLDVIQKAGESKAMTPLISKPFQDE